MRESSRRRSSSSSSSTTSTSTSTSTASNLFDATTSFSTGTRHSGTVNNDAIRRSPFGFGGLHNNNNKNHHWTRRQEAHQQSVTYRPAIYQPTQKDDYTIMLPGRQRNLEPPTREDSLNGWNNVSLFGNLGQTRTVY